MSTVTEAIRNHHGELLNTFTEQVAALVESRHDAAADTLVEFLTHDLLPHAAGEEQYLYPVVDPLIKECGRATAPMSVDHQFIEGYIRQISETVQALHAARAGERQSLERRLQRLAVQLEAILQLHLEKEESVYLPLFERYVPEKEQQQVLDAMHAVDEDGMNIKTVAWAG